MYTEIINNEELLELRLAFDMACNELGLGTSVANSERRERLALAVAREGRGTRSQRDPHASCASDDIVEASHFISFSFSQAAFVVGNAGASSAKAGAEMASKNPVRIARLSVF
jgi:hypothetical protein